VSFLAAGIVLLTGLLTWLLRGDSTPEPAPPPADDLVATQSLVGSEDAIASANAALESDKEPVGDLIQTALEEQTSEDKPAAAEAAAAEAAAAEEAQKAAAEAAAAEEARKAAAEAAAAEEARKAAAEAAAAEEARKAAKETTEPPSQPTSIDRYGVPTPMSAIPRNLPPGDSIAKKQANETAFTFPGSFTHNNNAMAVTNRARLNTIVEALQSNNKAIRIVGHTDSSGSATGNLRLGWLRAHSVKKLLVHMGISASRILVQSAGITQPIASNATAEGQAENRRVVILLTQ
jgi:outer membrane protein OmpA-like peptidoglycan-associated protein